MMERVDHELTLNYRRDREKHGQKNVLFSRRILDTFSVSN